MAVAPRISKARSRGNTRREELLDAAVAAIRATGPHATMEQLAAAGGITKPILYRHFGDRDGLITAIAVRYAHNLMASLQDTMRADEEPRDLVWSTIDTYLAFIEADSHLYLFLNHQAAGNRADQPAGPVSALAHTVAAQVADVITEQLRRRGLDTGPSVPWAYAIVGLVHQAGDWWIEDRGIARRQLVDYLTTLLWDGLDTAADRPAPSSANP